jgi:hypothetical protein
MNEQSAHRAGFKMNSWLIAASINAALHWAGKFFEGPLKYPSPAF